MSYGHIRRKKRPLPQVPVVPDTIPVQIETVHEPEIRYIGEKLYVTKDKRRPTSWRRCLSWIVACTVISVVLIIAILAGTGVILSQDDNLVKEASIGRNFAGANLKPSVTQPSSVTTMPTGTKALFSPTTDMSYMFVPRSIESELIIDNADFDPSLVDTNSSAFRQFADTMEDQLKMILFDKETLQFGASELALRVVNVSRDPFTVNYRIGWNPKKGSVSAEEPIKMEDVKKRMMESLARSGGYIDKYHIDGKNIKVGHVINTCQMNNGECSHICYYNYVTQLFTCTCPTHLVLDKSGKNCVEWTGSVEEDFLPVPDRNFNEQEAKRIHELPHSPAQQMEHQYKAGAGTVINDVSKSSYQETNVEPTPEPVTGSTSEFSSADTDRSHGKIYVHSDHKDHKAAFEPTSEPITDFKGNDFNKYNIETFTDSKNHEPAVEPTPESGAEDYGNVNAVKRPGTQSGIYVHSDNKDHEPAAEPTPEPNIENNGDAVGNNRPGTQSGVYVHSDNKDHEPAAEPTPEPTPEPNIENNGDAVGDNRHDTQSGGYVHPDNKDHEPAAEPTPEPNTENNGDTVNDYRHDTQSGVYLHSDKDKDHEPAAEPIPEPTPEPSIENNGDAIGGNRHGTQSSTYIHSDIKDHEPAAEPTPEPNTENNADTVSDNRHNTQSGVYIHSDNKDHEPAAEPTPEPTPEPSIENNGDAIGGNRQGTQSSTYIHSGIKDHEPAAEPTPEPNTENNGDTVSDNRHDTQSGVYLHSDKDKDKDHEPAIEPTPEPTPEPSIENNGDAIGDNRQGTQSSIYVHSDNKNHEPAATLTPEPSLNKELLPEGKNKEQTSESHSGVYIDSELKVREPPAQTTPLTTAQEEKNNVHHGVQVVSEDKEHEFSAKSTPARGPTETDGIRYTENDSRSYFHSKTKEYESAPDQTTEDSESNHGFNGGAVLHTEVNKEHVGQKHTPELSPEIKNQGHANDNTRSLDHSIEREPIAAEATPELEHYSKNFTRHSGSDSESHNVKIKGYEGEERETSSETNQSPNSEAKEQKISSVFNYEVNIKDGQHNHFSTSSQHQNHLEQTVLPGSGTGRVTPFPESTVEPTSKSTPELSAADKFNNSQATLPSQIDLHKTVPYLEQILIDDSMSNHSQYFGTDVQSQNPSSKHHVPLLEDILLKESTSKSLDGSIKNEPIIEEIVVDKPEQKDSSHNKMKTSTLGITQSPSKLENNSQDVQTKETVESNTQVILELEGRTIHPDSLESVTTHPQIIEYNAAVHSSEHMLNNPNIVTEQLQTKTSNRTSSEGLKTMYEKINGSTKSVGLHETVTVPVSIISGDFPTSLADDAIENRDPSSSKSTPDVIGRTEHPGIVNENSNVFKTSNDVVKESEGKVERNSVGKSKNNETQSVINEVSSGEYKRTQNRTQQPDINSQIVNETKQVPEELSNNIKDEGLDNDEFNTLLGPDYKRTDSGDEKEALLNKYPNKLSKGDKKKIKDYVKSDKTDVKKIGESTARPGIIPEDFFLQKNLNGNDNAFSFTSEQTPKNDGVSETEGIPGVSLEPHGISNHDIKVLQTVAPDFRPEAVIPADLEFTKQDTKTKLFDGESKIEKEYPKFEKEYKYDKQKGGKKKDLKKKGGNKDGKNVELDDHKYYTEVSGRELEAMETTINPPFSEEFGSTSLPENKRHEDISSINQSNKWNLDNRGPQTFGSHITISSPNEERENGSGRNIEHHDVFTGSTSHSAASESENTNAAITENSNLANVAAHDTTQSVVVESETNKSGITEKPALVDNENTRQLGTGKQEEVSGSDIQRPVGERIFEQVGVHQPEGVADRNNQLASENTRKVSGGIIQQPGMVVYSESDASRPFGPIITENPKWTNVEMGNKMQPTVRENGINKDVVTEQYVTPGEGNTSQPATTQHSQVDVGIVQQPITGSYGQQVAEEPGNLDVIQIKPDNVVTDNVKTVIKNLVPVGDSDRKNQNVTTADLDTLVQPVLGEMENDGIDATERSEVVDTEIPITERSELNAGPVQQQLELINGSLQNGAQISVERSRQVGVQNINSQITQQSQTENVESTSQLFSGGVNASRPLIENSTAVITDHSRGDISGNNYINPTLIREQELAGVTGLPRQENLGISNTVPVQERPLDVGMQQPALTKVQQIDGGEIYVNNEATQHGRQAIISGEENTQIPTDLTLEKETPNQQTNKKTEKVIIRQGVTDHNGQLIIDEPSVMTNPSLGTVYDGQLPGMVNFSDPNYEQTGKIGQVTGVSSLGGTDVLGTVFDGMPHKMVNFHSGDENATFVIYETTDSRTNGNKGSINFTTAHPTIIVRGQIGSLQDGHVIKSGNGTAGVLLNGTLFSPEKNSFIFTNYTKTFSNGSEVHPTIVVRGQSGALQDGHESRFGNYTFQTLYTAPGILFGNSTVYRIENGSLPGTVFDGHFNPQDGHFHTFTNSSGTFAYSNGTSSPSFVINGQSGDFGNSPAYILRNGTKAVFNFTGSTKPYHVIFRNSSVFAVPNATTSSIGTQESTNRPRVGATEAIQFTHQLSPSSFSSGTAYKVNNYFGYISKCAAGQFQCLNGTSKRGSSCISLSSKCDSINDCSDGSDELGCIENGCPGNFQCSDGSCLKRHLVCNGIVDCADGSDEKNCENWKCEFDEFQCPSGRCIPVVWQCDNKPDCDNHTDEYHCQTSCGNDEYLCPEGWCIPLTYKCNGIRECSNGEDEQLCDCSHDEFKCKTGGCVPKSQVCNGIGDCPDRSDEWSCFSFEPDSNLIKIRTPSGEYEPICADNWSLQKSDDVCASLGYASAMAIDNEGNSTFATGNSFFLLKNDTTDDSNRNFLVNLRRSNGTCFSKKTVEINCQEFSCGSRSMTDSSGVEARLVGGMSATAGQWPSVALLYNVRNFHSCTANVLTPRWVLASYNCLKMGNKNLNQQDWKMYGGSTVFEAEKENAETRNIVSIIPHPQVKFNQFLFSNDLALVELEKPLQFTNNLGAVCLPEQEIQPRQICVTAGWGMNSPEDKSMKQQLQYLPVPTMNLTECNSTDHYSGFITDDKICAGYNTAEKSLCYNEEGAPLMCVNDRGEWELQGVLSYHSNCGRGSHPSIFSSINPVRDWIKETIGNAFDRKQTNR